MGGCDNIETDDPIVAGQMRSEFGADPPRGTGDEHQGFPF
jgi:hypothetical protein